VSMELAISGVFPLAVFSQAPGEGHPRVLPPASGPAELAFPGYVLAAGIPFQPCFTHGDCPSSVLEAAYEAEMPIDIAYLSLADPQGAGSWEPLRTPGPMRRITPQDSVNRRSQPAEAPTLAEPGDAKARLFLPLVSALPGHPASTRCPCGWFGSEGRMLGFSFTGWAE
jgi:hypothetical protein